MEIFLIFILILGVIFLIRNKLVFNYRMNMILRGEYKKLDDVDYVEMVCKIWKPLDSFFK